MLYFTADQHHGHENIIQYCDRPFVNSVQMTRQIIRNHNNVVDHDDTCYHLGDFMWNKDVNRLTEILRRMNGTNILILGNHDNIKAFQYVEGGFESVHTSLWVADCLLVHDPAVSIMVKNSTVLCGHVHGLFEKCKNVVNVGVDVRDMKPVNFDGLGIGQ